MHKINLRRLHDLQFESEIYTYEEELKLVFTSSNGHWGYDCTEVGTCYKCDGFTPSFEPSINGIDLKPLYPIDDDDYYIY